MKGKDMTKTNDSIAEVDGVYQTTNIYQSAWLLLCEIPLIKIDRRNPKRAIFHFEDKDGNCDKLIRQYWENEQLQKFISKIQDIKAMLYAERGPVKYTEELPVEEKND